MSKSLRHGLVAFLAAFAAGAGPQELRLGMAADVTSMDPHFVNLLPNANIAEQVFEKLTTTDADSRLIPALATSWRAVDPTTWEFKLRQGVRFQDGSDFTAEDVAFSIDRVTIGLSIGTSSSSPSRSMSPVMRSSPKMRNRLSCKDK